MKLLGLDYGKSKIGLALADTESGVSLPYKIIKVSTMANVLKELKIIMAQENIKKIIIGLPINLQSASSQQTVQAKEFGKKLAQTVKLPVEFQDERFTSRQAQKLKPGKNDDALAAMLMLHSYLDRKQV